LNDILKKSLLEQSQEIGFSMMRICSPSDIPNAASKLNSFIEKNFEFVGDRFSQKVREIHYNPDKKKNIYGIPS
jgi:hypothetical protein